MPLSLKDSSVLKGIAILLMLCHHGLLLPGYFPDVNIAGMRVIDTFVHQCKVCVSIFVFVSGYGLMTKYSSSHHLKLGSFYRSRFVKLMFNYWFVWLIFVPLSVLWLSDKPFGWRYGDGFFGVKAICDFLGILNWDVNLFPYNSTWWFYSCIIGLYAIFPFLLWMLRRSIIFTVCLFVGVYFIPTEMFASVRNFIITFLCGMLYAKYSHRTKVINTPPRLGLAATPFRLFHTPSFCQWCFVSL